VQTIAVQERAWRHHVIVSMNDPERTLADQVLSN
jgi:hypothetical protein